ncbi:MAG: N-6 DNA methylase, partial [Elusimicrobia bacterium HGW-Elusimicrobia-4]
KANGIIYTPAWIVNLILDRIGYIKNIFTKKIVDPACGDGNFLIFIVERFLSDCKKNKLSNKKVKELVQNNIYGFDIDKLALDKCKNNLNEIADSYGLSDIKWNLWHIDILNKDRIKKYFHYFDYVVGNPPYIRIQHLGQERRAKVQSDWSFCKNGSTDIYIAFFELGLSLLNPAGKIGYITPNTFFKTDTAMAIRYYLMDKKYVKEIINFNHHQIFDNATTYSAITILDKNWNKEKFSYYEGNKEKIEFIDELNLTNIDYQKWTFASNEVLEKIRNIEVRGIPLGKIAKIHVGITTLADDFYIFKDPIFEKDKATIKLKDGREFTVEKSILKPIIKASVLKSPEEKQNRHVIFPYKKINGKHAIIPEAELKKEYPDTYKYFLAIKDRLFLRDKGKPNSVSWYAFGRSQGLDTSFGKKILVSPLSLKPNFIVWEKEEYTFFAGYCIKFDGDLYRLVEKLNSDDMEFYIKYVGRDYQNGYKSYAKSSISNFGVVGFKREQQEQMGLFR